MIEFVVVGAFMMLICIALIVVPLWRGATTTIDRRRQANIEVYRQRCRELDREVAAGRIEAKDADIEKQEFGARLLADVDTPASVTESPRQPMASASRRPWLAGLLSIVLVVTGSGATYYWLGDWQAMSDRDMPNTDQMLSQLKAHVAMNPEDRGARIMLAQVQQSRGQYEEAARNLAIINRAADQPSVALLVGEAEARLAANENLTGRAGELFQTVLQLDPTNIKALWFLGLRAVEAGNDRRAVDYWNRLLKQDLPDQVRSMVVSRRNALAGNIPGL